MAVSVFTQELLVRTSACSVASGPTFTLRFGRGPLTAGLRSYPSIARDRCVAGVRNSSYRGADWVWASTTPVLAKKPFLTALTSDEPFALEAAALAVVTGITGE